MTAHAHVRSQFLFYRLVGVAMFELRDERWMFVIWLYDYYRPVHVVRFAESPLKIGSLGEFVARVRARLP